MKLSIIVFFVIFNFHNIAVSNSCFTDVDSSTVIGKKICDAKEKGWIAGHGDGKFKPNDSLNRAESAKILAKYKGIEENRQNCFSDVKENDWFSAYVCPLSKTPIIDKKKDGLFHPADNVTFAEASKMALSPIVNINSRRGEWYKVYTEKIFSIDDHLFDKYSNDVHSPIKRKDFIRLVLLIAELENKKEIIKLFNIFSIHWFDLEEIHAENKKIVALDIAKNIESSILDASEVITIFQPKDKLNKVTIEIINASKFALKLIITRNYDKLEKDVVKMIVDVVAHVIKIVLTGGSSDFNGSKESFNLVVDNLFKSAYLSHKYVNLDKEPYKNIGYAVFQLYSLAKNIITGDTAALARQAVNTIATGGLTAFSELAVYPHYIKTRQKIIVTKMFLFPYYIEGRKPENSLNSIRKIALKFNMKLSHKDIIDIACGINKFHFAFSNRLYIRGLKSDFKIITNPIKIIIEFPLSIKLVTSCNYDI